MVMVLTRPQERHGHGPDLKGISQRGQVIEAVTGALRGSLSSKVTDYFLLLFFLIELLLSLIVFNGF